MSSTFIRVLGDTFDPAKELANVAIQPNAAFVKGEIPEGRMLPSRTGGIRIDIGTGDLDEQIESAKIFLQQHANDLRRLSLIESVESFFIEFEVELRLSDDILIQRDFLSSDFVKSVGNVGLGICISTAKPFQCE